jgi:hypothetical protein
MKPYSLDEVYLHTHCRNYVYQRNARAISKEKKHAAQSQSGHNRLYVRTPQAQSIGKFRRHGAGAVVSTILRGRERPKQKWALYYSIDRHELVVLEGTCRDP